MLAGWGGALDWRRREFHMWRRPWRGIRVSCNKGYGLAALTGQGHMGLAHLECVQLHGVHGGVDLAV